MSGSFGGTTAACYARYRRGYPERIVDAVVDLLRLGSEDAVLDLGCGTGLLTTPLAPRIGLAVGADPEPDMLAEARRAAGSVAIISNGTPLWQQDSDWSRALRSAIDDWFHTTSSSTCGTSEADRARYRSALVEAGFAVEEVRCEYEAAIGFDEIVGGLFSALSPNDVPDDRRDAFVEHIARAVDGTATFTEVVPVIALVGVAR